MKKVTQNSKPSFKVRRYTTEDSNDWNKFVAKSKNATFLFHRDFMDYHSDRFDDYSLLVFKEEKLVAIFPANRVDNIIYSHQGLTYGGLVIHEALKFQDVLESFKSILIFLNSNGFETLELKLIPPIYNSLPSDEINYFMFLLNAELLRRDVLSVIDLDDGINISKNRIEGYKRAKRHKLEIKEEREFNEFWNGILIPNLKLKHNANPVHSLNEITLLKQHFPNNIRQFNVYFNDNIVGGATIFETKKVAHAQYISANIDKNMLGSLDYLHFYLINEVFANKKYFDFGISNKNQGKNINEGLLFWKEGFGAKTITQDFYRVSTKNHFYLNNIML
ncbi:MAG: GNAT family N-acetyltransferase [Flavobacteriaceae bacterium]|nr:GNAT family N-acetyltransferase [Flavobacteriaceae bacterium]